jgi:hypothetical protein
MQTDDAFLIVYAQVTYQDIFGISHWTRFCNENSVALGSKQMKNTSTASKCVAYNHVDKN